MCNCSSCQIKAEIVAVAMIRWIESLPGRWKGHVETAWPMIETYLVVPAAGDALMNITRASTLRSRLFSFARVTGGLRSDGVLVVERMKSMPCGIDSLEGIDASGALNAAEAILRGGKEGSRETT